jgi:isopenicillin-N N-acyltransferase-like protein
MKQNKLDKIIISGDPVTRGRQYGSKAKRLIEKGLGFYQSAFLELCGFEWTKALDFSKTFLPGIKDHDDTIIDEIKGMAEGSGRSFEEILTLNIRSEIIYGMKKSTEGCTAFCVLPEITAEHHTILAQNWDYKPWASDSGMMLQINQKDGPDILTFVEAGQFARMGMNSAGHGICNNYIQCDEDGKGSLSDGLSTTFIRRKALSEEHYHSLIAAIIHTRRTFSCNYLVATSMAGGDAINIEATPETYYFLYPENGIVTHSNHFKGAGPGNYGIKRPGLENSIYRDRRVERHLRKKTGQIKIEDAQDALRDHFGFPYSVCRHPDPKKPLNAQWQSNISIIMDLTAKEMWVSNGPPCENAYFQYTFDNRKG